MKDLLVIYRDTNTEESRLQKGFNGLASIAYGRDWVIQKIAKQLLTNSGSSAYTPTYGGFLGGLVGSTFIEEDLDLYKTFLVKSINKIESNIIDQQSLYPDLKDSEILKSIDVQSMSYDQENAKMEIFLKITMANNNTLSMRV